MKPYVVAFGPWLPDGADVVFGMPFQYMQTVVPCADVNNVYYSRGAYRSLPTIATVAGSPVLPSAALGAVTAAYGPGSTARYVGTSSDLYLWNGSAWTVVSKAAGAYAGAAHWSMVEFAGCVLAADGVHPLQDATINSGNFADVATAPIGNVLGVIGQFLIVGDITSPTAFPYRVQWSGIGDPGNWPVPLTIEAIAAESSYEDLTQDFGQVMFIGGGPQLGVILQRTGITRAQYVGGDVVFDFLPFERKQGLIARGAAVQVGAFTHFISDSGFRVTDGSQVNSTGSTQAAALDKWLLNNLNLDATAAIRCAYDSSLRVVMFALPTGVNTLPDTLLLLNTDSGQWTKGQQALEFLWTHDNGTQHVADCFDQSHTLSEFTGAPLTGYCETYDMSFLDSLFRDLPQATPHIVCSDSPTMRITTKRSADDVGKVTGDMRRNGFSRSCTFDPSPSGLFMRARVSSANASAINGATLFTTDGTAV